MKTEKERRGGAVGGGGKWGAEKGEERRANKRGKLERARSEKVQEDGHKPGAGGAFRAFLGGAPSSSTPRTGGQCR